MFKKKYVTSNNDWNYLHLKNFSFISALISLIQKIIERVFKIKIIKKFNWVHVGRSAKGSYKNKFDKKLLNNYYFSTAPNISRITGYHFQSPMTFIVKK
jgi:hypothetical protein